MDAALTGSAVRIKTRDSLEVIFHLQAFFILWLFFLSGSCCFMFQILPNLKIKRPTSAPYTSIPLPTLK